MQNKQTKAKLDHEQHMRLHHSTIVKYWLNVATKEQKEVAVIFYIYLENEKGQALPLIRQTTDAIIQLSLLLWSNCSDISSCRYYYHKV